MFDATIIGCLKAGGCPLAERGDRPS
jgi:hypothetical protein